MISTFNLHERAVRAMRELGLASEFPPDVLNEASDVASSVAPIIDRRQTRDLRGLLWSSIDNQTSRDLDQLEYCERLSGGRFRLMVAIADVDSCVHERGAIDNFASDRTVSVYTGAESFPMLPDILSFDHTSLVEIQDRSAVVVEMRIGPAGEIERSDIFLALVQNQARLDYEHVGNWLETGGSLGESASVPGLENQLRLQSECAALLRGQATERGALEIETAEMNPVVKNGRVTAMTEQRKNEARDIIESFMIAANMSIARFLHAEGIPCIERVVGRPKRWDRIVAIARANGGNLPDQPNSRALAKFLATRKRVDREQFADLSLAIVKLLGAGEYDVVMPDAPLDVHFGLAVTGYTHSTAPNRRFADLVIQRLVKHVLDDSGTPPYSTAQLKEIAVHCNVRAAQARKVERLMRKVAAASMLAGQVGQSFDALVTGVKNSGVYVRLLRTAAEGKVVAGGRDMDVGDIVSVRLIGVDQEQGHIDFAIN